MEYIAIFIGIAIVLALIMLMFIYNRLVALRQTRNNAFADIDVQLQVRYDLIPNLVEVVKKYAAHEKEIFENVAHARSGAMNASSLRDKGMAENLLGLQLTQLLAVSENYPALKADHNFAKLQDQLVETEQTVAAARRFFNNATAEFNSAIEQFPAVLFARNFGFITAEFLDIGETQRHNLQKTVKVEL